MLELRLCSVVELRDSRTFPCSTTAEHGQGRLRTFPVSQDIFPPSEVIDVSFMHIAISFSGFLYTHRCH